MFKLSLVHTAFNSKTQIKTGVVVNKLFQKNARNISITPEVFKKCILNGDTWIPSVCDTPIKDNNNNNLVIGNEKELEEINSILDLHMIWDENQKKSVLNTDYSTFKEYHQLIYRKREICWTEQWLFGLDFDSHKEDKIKNVKELIIDFNEVDKILVQNNITPFFIYETMSHIPKYPKRRYVMQLKTPIKSYQEAKWYQNKIMDLFPKKLGSTTQCDIACKDLCRVFYGTNDTKKLVFFNPNIYQDLSVLPLPPVFKNTDFEEKYKNYYTLQNSNTSCNTNILLNHSNVYKGKCVLLDKWQNQDYSLGFSDMQALVTIFLNIQNGRTEWEKGLIKNEQINGSNAYDSQIWLNNFDSMQKKGYKSIACKNCNHCSRKSHTPLDFFVNVKPPKMNIKYLGKKIYTETIDDASLELNNFVTSIHTKTNFKWAINAPTGIGKTEIIIKLVKNNDIVAVPTHALNKEIANRLTLNGTTNFIISLERPKLHSQSDEDDYRSLEKKGMIWEASNFWKEKVSKYSKPNDCDDYLKNQEIIKNCEDKIILCTHAKLDHLINTRKIKNKPIGVIYIDEDPTENIFIKEEIIYLSDLEKFINLISPPALYIKDLTEKIDYIYKTMLNGKKTINWFDYISDFSVAEIKELKNLFTNYFYKQYPNIQYPVHHIFSEKIYDEKPKAEYLINRVRMEVDEKTKANMIKIIKKNEIKHNRIFLFSATINGTMSKLLGFNFKNINYDYRNSNLLQYPLLNLNKSDLTLKNKNNSKCIEKAKKINEILKDEDLIILTHMGLENKKNIFKYINHPIHPQIHFWNSEGYDILKGNDIAIIGTPRKHDNAIFTIAAGLDIPIINVMKNKNIKTFKNDFEFIYYTFKDPSLAEIETYLIDKELTQLIGRARATRTDAKVFIFSNYPTKGVNLKDDGI